MPRACSVCSHPDRAAIDKALVAGEPAPRIAALHRVSEDALLRHRANHLPKLLAQARDRETARETDRATALAEQAEAREIAQATHAIDVVRQLRAINAAALGVLEDARERQQGELVLKAVDRVHRQVELQAKLLGELDERPVVNVLVSPQWLAVRAAMLDALRPFPEARAAVADRLVALEAGDAR